MTIFTLPLLHYYEAELIPMGYRCGSGTGPPDLTADEDMWRNKEPDILNIFVTLRGPDGDDPFEEVMDLDIPAEFPKLAVKLFNRISSEVNFSNRQRIQLQ